MRVFQKYFDEYELWAGKNLFSTYVLRMLYLGFIDLNRTVIFSVLDSVAEAQRVQVSTRWTARKLESAKA